MKERTAGDSGQVGTRIDLLPQVFLVESTGPCSGPLQPVPGKKSGTLQATSSKYALCGVQLHQTPQIYVPAPHTCRTRGSKIEKEELKVLRLTSTHKKRKKNIRRLSTASSLRAMHATLEAYYPAVREPSSGCLWLWAKTPEASQRNLLSKRDTQLN